jgi:integrase
VEREDNSAVILARTSNMPHYGANGPRQNRHGPRDRELIALAGARVMGNDHLRSVRDVAMISVLVDCGLRRAELSALTVEDLLIRRGHWAIKGGHVRTVPVPVWAKGAVDRWRESAKVAEGRIVRAVSRHGTPWGKGISENVI